MMRIISVSIDMLLWIKLQDFNNLVWPPWRWPWRLERLCLLPGMLYPLWNLVFPVWNPREPPVKHRTWLLMRKVILLHLSNFKVTLFFFQKETISLPYHPNHNVWEDSNPNYRHYECTHEPPIPPAKMEFVLSVGIQFVFHLIRAKILHEIDTRAHHSSRNDH